MEFEHVLVPPNHAAWVMRRIDQNRTSFKSNCSLNFVEIRLECAGCQRHSHNHATRHFDIGNIAVVTRLQNNHFVTRMNYGQHDSEQSLCSTCCDRDFRLCIVVMLIELINFLRNSFTQWQDAWHGWVLIKIIFHGLCHRIDQSGVTFKVRESLA